MPPEGQQPTPEAGFELLLEVPLRVSVELGKTTMRIQELLELGQGAVVDLDRLAGEPVDILVNGRQFAQGEIVVVNDRYAVRVLSIRSPTERIESLG